MKIRVSIGTYTTVIGATTILSMFQRCATQSAQHETKRNEFPSTSNCIEETTYSTHLLLQTTTTDRRTTTTKDDDNIHEREYISFEEDRTSGGG